MSGSKQSKLSNTAGVGSGYILGFVGALVYYLPIADSFWTSVLAVVRASVWPAFLVHDMLQFIH